MPGAFAVVGGGAAAVDELVFVDGSIGDGKGRVLRRERRFGGNIATALAAAAREGVGCAFLGHLPDDTVAPDLLAHLRDEGVDLSLARTSAGTRPIRSTILVGTDGDRFIAFDDDTAVGLPDDLDLDLVREARVLLLDAYNPAEGLRAAAAARAAGVAVVADLENVDAPRLEELAALADHLVVPQGLAVALTGAGTPAEAVDLLWRADRAAVVVTGGAEGCWYRSSEQPAEVRHQPAPRVAVVDTTGCGDVFHGVYAAALAQGAPVERCVSAATAAAAECATHPGGFPSRPDTDAGRPPAAPPVPAVPRSGATTPPEKEGPQ